VKTVDHAAIAEALRAGESQNGVARRFGIGAATVNRIAKRNGLKYSAPKNAAICRRDYAAAERLALLNKLFDKVSELADGPLTPTGLQALTISAGILTDKRRLEDGEATARTEVHGGGAREQLARSLDELAARRRSQTAAG
jgi:transposase-like protein